MTRAIYAAAVSEIANVPGPKSTFTGGQKFSIEGWQPSDDAAEFNIKPDASGETYKTTKTTRDGSEAWESSSLTLTQTK